MCRNLFRNHNDDIPINAIKVLESIFGVKRTKRLILLPNNCFELSVKLTDGQWEITGHRLGAIKGLSYIKVDNQLSVCCVAEDAMSGTVRSCRMEMCCAIASCQCGEAAPSQTPNSHTHSPSTTHTCR